MPWAETEWPSLATPAGLGTARTIQLWAQVLGKTRLQLSPTINHWWQVPLYVTARGLGTSLIPYATGGFEVELDLLAGSLGIRTSEGTSASFQLEPGPVADFHRRFFHALGELGVDVAINPIACEIPELIDLARDEAPRPYDADWARTFFRVLLRVDRLLKAFRSPFLGKVSPVHFFWGSFDLAVTRFSGRRAPPHPGHAPHVKDSMMREAYSHEVSSAGFWPGSADSPEALFYSYAYPGPAGFSQAHVLPERARYDEQLGEFVLPYEALRASPSPESDVLMFLESTYAAAANLARWPREQLERHPGARPLDEASVHALDV